MTAPPEPQEALTGKVVSGSIWLFSSYALSKLGRIGIMLTIAALLSPQDYGIIALTSVIIMIAEMVTEFGLWPAVVHRSDPDDTFLSTAFTTNILVGLVTMAGVFLAAPWIALFYQAPQMTDVLRVMGIGLIPWAIYSVPDGLLRKELMFKRRALPEISGTLGGGAVTIGLVLLGFGVVSYAIGQVVEKTLVCILTLKQISWRPKLKLSFAALKELTAYGKHIVGSELARHVSSNMDFLIVGRVLGAGPLGFYTLAFNLANYPVTHFALILSRIAFPTFSILQEDTEQARRVYLKILRLVSGLLAPLLVTLAFLAAPLIVGLLGERWQPAVLPLQLMVIAGLSRSLSIPGTDMLRAVGYPSVPLKINVLESIVISGALVLLANRGIDVVALTVVTIVSLASWAITVSTCRAFKIGFWELLRTLMPGTALAASAAVAIVPLRLLGVGSLAGGILDLALLSAAAAGAMVLCLTTVCRGFFREVVALVPSRGLS